MKKEHKIELIPPTTTEMINTVCSKSRGRLLYACGKNRLTDYVALQKIPYIETRDKLFDLSLAESHINGLYIELGVFKGGTITTIANKIPNKTIYGLDSWEGFPEDYTEVWRKGTCKCEMPEVPSNVKLIKGLIEDTLPNLLSIENKPIAFLHVDCDLYSATRSALFDSAQYIVPGTVIQFDELFEMIIEGEKSWWWTHEFDALNNFVKRFKVTYKWLGSTGTHANIIIESIRYEK
jgi:hypothetical protein